MSKATQKDRLLSISTNLAFDTLLIDSFACYEGVSELFEIEVTILREENIEDPYKFTPVDVNEILGQRGSIMISQEDGSGRCFTGIFKNFMMVGRDKYFSKYNATIVPHVWKLTQHFGNRIYQQMSVPEILEKVFEDYECKFQLQRNYKKRNYCVQYQETAFDFASRIMEEEGIYYYFEHKPEMERMVFRDDYKNPEDCPGKSDIPVYDAELLGKGRWESTVGDFNIAYELSSGKFTYWDYKFELPTKKLDVEKTSRYSVGGNQDMEVYIYPGGYARHYDGIDKTGGDQTGELNNIFDDNKLTATNQMLAHDIGYKIINGRSNCSSLTAGYRFNLKNHPNSDINGAYIVTRAAHSAGQHPGYITGADTGEAYTCTFGCIPHGSGHPEFRPKLKTKKPIIMGSQSAFVVGPSGDEIFVDKYGRVKVQFTWDRDGSNDGGSSCWVRVLKDLAGNKYGSMYIPRVGQEVLVDFIGGNPDQPVIIGSMYNPDTMPHYELPKFKTLTYIKTRTSPDDGQGFNELRFEDKQGKEQVFMHSQKRWDTRVKESMYETCGGNRQERIGVRSDNQPGGNLAITVGGNQDLHVKGDDFIKIDGKRNEAVTGEVVEDYQASQSTQVGGSYSLNARSITLEAMTSISLKVGGTFISADSSGIKISGPMVMINSGGAAQGTSPASIDDPLDAESADTGEPGYLDRPRSGGGPRTRNRRTLNGLHAPPFATRTLPNGDIQVGNGLVIRQSANDPDFQNKVLADLTEMSNHPQGMDTLNSINNSGQTVAIQDQNTGGNSYEPSNVQGALPDGQTGNFGGGIGTVTGDGSGSGGTVNYNPDNARNNAIRPRDVGLHHELSHADHAANGNYDILNPDPATPNNPHMEETNTINADNNYRRQRGVHTRRDHTTL
ncbi:MAG: type VI secretion system tip protein TssI/VgrG [Pyrinomonadaceae bacterium]